MSSICPTTVALILTQALDRELSGARRAVYEMRQQGRDDMALHFERMTARIEAAFDKANATAAGETTP